MSDTPAGPPDAGPPDAGPPDAVGFGTVRAELEAERDTLAIHVAEADPHEGIAPQFDDNLSDRGQVAAEQTENRQLATQLREQLDDVEFALRRLDDGSYGLCLTCGEAIPDERLEAMPAARFCMVCAS